MRTLIVAALCFALLPLWPAERARVETRARHYPSGSLREEAEALIVPGETPVYHGRCRRFAESGALISEGRYQNGLMNGTWRWYDENGVLLAAGAYRDDFSSEVTFYNPDGSVLARGPKQGNLRAGLWTQWYPSGRVHLRGEFIDGQMHGTWTYFTDTDPQQQETAVYEHGERVP